MHRLTDETLDNAIGVYKTVIKACEEYPNPDYDTTLDKVIVSSLEELKEYRHLKEQGLLLRLPCKVGDKIYHVIKDSCANPPIYISEHVITDVSAKGFCAEGDDYWWKFDELENMNAFLTKEKAEQKLAEMKGAEKDCSNCENYTEPDEVDNGCYMCVKGYENNYSPKKQRNGDRIRAMTDEELTKIIMCPYDTAGEPEEIMPYIRETGNSDFVTEKECRRCMLEWLQREVENG